MNDPQASPPHTAAAHAGGAGQLVQLAPDHPGFRDRDYRQRRDAIARLALEYKAGDPAPTVAYTAEEHAVWRTVWEHLDPLHARLVCSEVRALLSVVRLDRERIPQLADVNAQIQPLYGFRMLPVAGLVMAQTFLSYLARDTFLSTQYIRHYSRPLYTPEPDVVHELVGHASTFGDPDFIALNRAFGQAVVRAAGGHNAARTSRRIEEIARVYWYTLEFGVALEDGTPKAYGAGLLSSYGELERLASPVGGPRLRPFELAQMAITPYDPTDYQARLFVAPSFGEMVKATLAWLAAE